MYDSFRDKTIHQHSKEFLTQHHYREELQKEISTETIEHIMQSAVLINANIH